MDETEPFHENGNLPENKERPSKVWAYVKTFCLDMLPVIMGVVLGLFLNTVREERQSKQLLLYTLEALSNEFRENTIEINKKLIRHVRIIDTLNFYRDNEKMSLNDAIVKAGGLVSSNISTTNWRSALNTYSLQLINFSTLKLLANIDNLHQDLAKQLDVLYGFTYSPFMYRYGPESTIYKRNVYDLMIEYRTNEMDLIQLYEEFSSKVKNKEYENE